MSPIRKLIAAFIVVWFWIDAGGAYCFTDDPDRIPAIYADQAERVESGSIFDYPKTTIIRED